MQLGLKACRLARRRCPAASSRHGFLSFNLHAETRNIDDVIITIFPYTDRYPGGFAGEKANGEGKGNQPGQGVRIYQCRYGPCAGALVFKRLPTTFFDGTENTALKYSLWEEGSSSTTAGVSCSILYTNGIRTSGIYWIKPTGYTGDAFKVYCDQSDGGGWTKILHAAGSLNWGSSPNSYGDVTLAPANLAGAAKLADAQIRAIQGGSSTGFSTFKFYGNGNTDAAAYLRTSNAWENPSRSMGLLRPSNAQNAAYGCESRGAKFETCTGAWTDVSGLGSIDTLYSGGWGDNTGFKVAANDHTRYFVDYYGANDCYAGGGGALFLCWIKYSACTAH